jgi:large subunit ribosomal protein L25
MSYALTVQSRELLGRQAKQVMNTGNIPGVVYGNGIKPQSISLNGSDFRKIYRTAGKSSLIDVTIDSATAIKVLIKEVQVHPITMTAVHADFYQINMTEELTTKVPLKFIGEAPAVKSLAGTLLHPIVAVTITCLPANLPHEIEVDISKLLTFDDVITVGSLTLPPGVKIDDDVNITLAAVVAPMTEEQLLKMDEPTNVDVTSIKTEAEEKRAAEEAKKSADSETETTK